eukprot:1516365-Prymnesium_polylepis.2
MPTGPKSGDGRAIRPPREAGAHRLRPWRCDILCVPIAKETYHVHTRDDTVTTVLTRDTARGNYYE